MGPTETRRLLGTMSTTPLTFEQFAQRLLQLLDEGRFVATYKFAVLLGLIEALAEDTDTDGRAPASVSTRALARTVIDIYWPHTRAYPTPPSPMAHRRYARTNSDRPGSSP